jgi:hypothetical protein
VRLATRVGGAARRSLALLLCACGAHAALHRSFLPGDAVHAYFRWYEPVVGALSATALLVFAGLLLSALAGPRGRERVRRLLRPSQPGLGVQRRAVRLGLATTLLVLVQESVEQSVAAGAPRPAAFPASGIVLLLLATGLLALVVALLERSGRLLLRLVLGAPVRLRRAGPLARPAPAAAVRRRNPLALRLGLRAPPLPA